MKVSDIIVESVWQGIRKVGSGLGNVAGSTISGALGMADKLTGGTGVRGFGTLAQLSKKDQELERKAHAIIEKQYGNLAYRAMDDFILEMDNMGYSMAKIELIGRLANPRIQAEANRLRKYLLDWTKSYYTFGMPRDSMELRVFMDEFQKIPFPALKQNEIFKYFKEAENIKKAIAVNVVAYAEMAAERDEAKRREALAAAGPQPIPKSTLSLAQRAKQMPKVKPVPAPPPPPAPAPAPGPAVRNPIKFAAKRRQP